MKLFIMGATGYIGSVVAEYLIRDGHELVGLARSEEAAAKLREAGIEPVRGQLGDTNIITEQVKRADGVVSVTTGGFMLQALSTVRDVLDTTDAVIAAAAGTNKPVLITWGIAAWMDTGWYNVERIVTEEDPISWQYFYHHLAESQRRYEAAADVRYIGIFPGGVYGRGGSYIGGIARAFDGVRRTGKVHMIAGADNAASHVHVDDLAELYVLALRDPETRGRFIASSQILSTPELNRAVSVAAGLGGEVTLVDQRTMRDFLGRYTEVDGFINLRGSGQKAMDVLGWRPKQKTVVEELTSLPQPFDISTIYPSPDRQKAKMAALAVAGAAAAGKN